MRITHLTDHLNPPHGGKGTGLGREDYFFLSASLGDLPLLEVSAHHSEECSYQQSTNGSNWFYLRLSFIR